MTFAQEKGLPLEQLVSAIQRGKAQLLELREQRIHPLRDDKVLTSWKRDDAPQPCRSRRGAEPPGLPGSGQRKRRLFAGKHEAGGPPAAYLP